jgi:2,5-diketo-D-gluconate reductase A
MTTTLRDQMPPIGLGTWPLTGTEGVDAILSGLDAGYRHVDTAAIYENEDAVGEAVRASGLPREELFLTSKLRGRDHVDGDIRGAVERSLERMGLEQLDLYLIHWPMTRFDQYVDAFTALLECRNAGLVRHVGVSNFLGPHLRRVTEAAGEAPAVNQIQLDPTLTRIPVRRADDELGVLTSSWSPLGRGDALTHAVVLEVAERHGCTAAQAVLAWHRAQGLVPIVRSADPARQAENLAALQVELDVEDVARLGVLDRGESAARDVDAEEHF